MGTWGNQLREQNPSGVRVRTERKKSTQGPSLVGRLKEFQNKRGLSKNTKITWTMTVCPHLHRSPLKKFLGRNYLQV